MNSILRILSRPGLPAVELARLLEKHVGKEPSALHCEAALAALRRIHDQEKRLVVCVTARLSESDSDPCTTLQEIIAQLRTADWTSQ